MYKYLLCFLCASTVLRAQTPTPTPKIALHIVGSDKPDFLTTTTFTAPLSYTTVHPDTASVLQYIDTILVQLQRKGFWAASVDSLSWQKTGCKATFFVGNIYKFNSIQNGNIEQLALDEIGFRQNVYQQQVIAQKTVFNLKEKLLQWAENHGYPFCNVWIAVATDTPTKGEITGTLYWRKGKRFTIEKPIIEGNSGISAQFLIQYLDIDIGKAYNEATIQKFKKRINDLPFIQEKQAFTIDFVQERNANKARPHFFLKRKKASRFDVLVGFLPATEPGKPLNITGNAEIEFQNLFNGGQQFRFQATQVRAESPEAKFFMKLPYIFNLPLGVDANFELYKRDTAYIDVRSELGINYQLKANDYIKVYWNTFNTDLLTIDSIKIKNLRRLPDVIDVQNNGFGIEYHTENLDYRFCPRKGWSSTLRAGVNFKKVKENNKITALFDADSTNRFDYTQLYDSLRAPITQYRARLSADYYLPIGIRNVVKIGIASGGIFSKKPLYRNEQFRIGGAKLLRGFSEEALFSNFFAISTLEYRFLLSQNSYLFAFLDQAYVEDRSIKSRIFDQPSGVGGGLTLDTKAGIFGLTIAFGQQQQNGFDFNAAKVHFGYVNLF